MDYQGCEHPFTILYRPLPKGIGGYFSYLVSSPIDISVDVPPIGCLVESTLHPLPAKGVLRVIVGFPNWQRIKVKQAGFTRIGLLRNQNRDVYQFRLVL